MGGIVGGVTLIMVGPVSASASMFGADTGTSINDASTTHRIQLYAAALVLAGIALGAITMWLWRSTKPDPEALGALSVMSRRTWRRGAEDERVHALARAHNIPDPPATAPPVDLAVLARSRSTADLGDHAGFGDLVEPVLPGPGLPRPELPPPAVPLVGLSAAADPVVEFGLPKPSEPDHGEEAAAAAAVEQARADATE